MLAITVELLHGTIRAGSPDDTVMAGGDEGEWPPSPARLFSALVAGDGTRDRCTVTSGEELLWLEGLGPPRIHASALTDVLVAPLRPRFAVVDATHTGAVQDYPARAARVVRRGARQAPKNATLTYVWPDASPSDGTLASLRLRADRVGYIGCSDSPARVVVSDSVPVGAPEPWRPASWASHTLPIPFPGFLDALDGAFDRWSAGQAMRRAWIRSERACYQPPGERRIEAPPAPVTIWLRFDRAVVGRKLVALTETLRCAVLDHVQRLLPPGAAVPSALHGHRPGGEEGPQARFLALPDVGHGRSDGRLFGAVVWLPPGCDAEVIQLTRTAVARLATEQLVKPGWFDISLAIQTGERRPWAARPERWVGPARRWESATPVVHERWTRHLPNLDEVGQWCRHAGLPAPIDVAFRRHPKLPGALDLRPDQVHRAGRERRPHSHVVITFGDTVEGPVVLGRGRHLGLGLMVPADRPGGQDG